jgi:hypothetical protein
MVMPIPLWKNKHFLRMMTFWKRFQNPPKQYSAVVSFFQENWGFTGELQMNTQVQLGCFVENASAYLHTSGKDGG